jgi:Outer membrane protein beta-barrel domain
MKERNFYSDEFEELIRQKTGQFKMYPSDKVWKEIYNSLHTRRRRFVMGMSVLIGGILIVAAFELLQPSKHAESVIKIAITDLPKTSPASAVGSFIDFKKASLLRQGAAVASQTAHVPGQQNDQLASLFNEEVSPGPAEVVVAYTDPASYFISTSPEIPSGSASNLSQAATPSPIDNSEVRAAVHGSMEDPSTLVSLHLPAPEPGVSALPGTGVQQEAKKSSLSPLLANPDHQSAADKLQSNWLQDYAVEHLTPIREHRLGLQVYFSPTVNYRNLAGANYDASKTTVQNVPVALVHFGNVNNFVDHSPAIGYEAGTSILYRITRNLTFKAGVQFNYSKYNILAYSSGVELGTIALSSPYVSYLGYLADSVSSYTNVRNFGGKSRITLQNKYYQLSAPLGFEYRLLGSGKLQVVVAGTIQPTYLLNRNSYLLTSDYMSYVKEPSLFRRWNVNGAAEAYLAYQAGGIRWQIGPQFRYQLLSTYTDDYPLKENLKEYGIKIGISKIIR